MVAIVLQHYGLISVRLLTLTAVLGNHLHDDYVAFMKDQVYVHRDGFSALTSRSCWLPRGLTQSGAS